MKETSQRAAEPSGSDLSTTGDDMARQAFIGALSFV
jgi:hypothetical protein